MRDTPLVDRKDYQAKRKALQDIQLDPDTPKDRELSAELVRRTHSLEKQAKQKGFTEDKEDESFGIQNLDSGTKRLLVKLRSRYPWTTSDLEALLTYVHDEDEGLEKEIGSLEKHDSIHDRDIDQLDTELDREQQDLDSATQHIEDRLTDVEQRLKELTARVMGGIK